MEIGIVRMNKLKLFDSLKDANEWLDEIKGTTISIVNVSVAVSAGDLHTDSETLIAIVYWESQKQ